MPRSPPVDILLVYGKLKIPMPTEASQLLRTNSNPTPHVQSLPAIHLRNFFLQFLSIFFFSLQSISFLSLSLEPTLCEVTFRR